MPVSQLLPPSPRSPCPPFSHLLPPHLLISLSPALASSSLVPSISLPPTLASASPSPRECNVRTRSERSSCFCVRPHSAASATDDDGGPRAAAFAPPVSRLLSACQTASIFAFFASVFARGCSGAAGLPSSSSSPPTLPSAPSSASPSPSGGTRLRRKCMHG
eukprot:365166-Chlamydomonas_euryale.AAC.15